MGGGLVKTVGSRTRNCSYKFYSFTSGVLSNPGQVTAVLGVMLALQNITYFNCQRQCALVKRTWFWAEEILVWDLILFICSMVMIFILKRGIGGYLYTGRVMRTMWANVCKTSVPYLELNKCYVFFPMSNGNKRQILVISPCQY